MDHTAIRPPLILRAQTLTSLNPRVVAWGKTAAHLWGVDTRLYGRPEEPWPLELLGPKQLAYPDCLISDTPIPPEDITVHAGVRLTTRERTALDCAVHLPRFEAVAALDQFFRAGVSREALAARVRGLRLAGRVHRAREALRLSDRGAASPRESWIRLILVDAHLPRPRTQIHVRLTPTRRCYLDLGWPEFRTATEYDGREHHTTEADRRHDAARREALREVGWHVIPVRRDVIPRHVGDYLEQVANALLERGWRPTSGHLLRVRSRIRAMRRRPLG